MWPRFLAGILAARLASWYHLAWSSLLLPCQANRLTARGCCIHFPYKYVKSHFSGRVNDLSKAHYFFTEVERVTKHIVTREIHDNKIRELARVYLSRAVTTRWMPGALAPARSSCRCSSNSASTRHLTFAVTNLLITDVGTAGCDTPHPDVAYLQIGRADGLGQLSRGFSDLPRGCTRLLPRKDLLPSPLAGYLASVEDFSFSSSAGCSTCRVSNT